MKEFITQVLRVTIVIGEIIDELCGVIGSRPKFELHGSLRKKKIGIDPG